MRHYEIVFLVHPDQSEQVPMMLEHYVQLVKQSGGIIHRQEDWGRRQLAYPINKLHKAHFLLLNIECEYNAIEQITSNFRFNDAILRHLVLRRDYAINGASYMLKHKEESSYHRNRNQGVAAAEENREAEGSNEAEVAEAGAAETENESAVEA